MKQTIKDYIFFIQFAIEDNEARFSRKMSLRELIHLYCKEGIHYCKDMKCYRKKVRDD